MQKELLALSCNDETNNITNTSQEGATKVLFVLEFRAQLFHDIVCMSTILYEIFMLLEKFSQMCRDIMRLLASMKSRVVKNLIKAMCFLSFKSKFSSKNQMPMQQDFKRSPDKYANISFKRQDNINAANLPWSDKAFFLCICNHTIPDPASM